MTDIAREVFPEIEQNAWPVEVTEEYIRTDMLEVMEEAERLKCGRTPGPDGIPPEVVKVMVEISPETIAKIMNTIFEHGVYPEAWKVARLFLLEKKVNETTIKYRPICLLDCWGKLAKRIMVRRLRQQCILSESQYGFRQGRSTADAVRRIVQLGRLAMSGAWTTREPCVLITLDERNAFNTIPWNVVMDALGEAGVEASLKRANWKLLLR